ncbi:nuclear transport factor 2 family protein [Streptomyces coelicoflavus]|uniref:Nuclear transport factor 2 family protein n=1 Tax=Streptomyces coelicoflavus TaxID=285562 RepID=A0A7K3PSM0_9ACTN|nr:nuclear transport factor 2 family protein [Streptomyces coelicoflavus]NEB12837.1 nuclear transport factor 2 family protein [Streptomyces coelicoflavus]
MTSSLTTDQSASASASPSAADSGAAVASLLHRYLLSLDDEELDEAWTAGLFTGDAVVAFPVSRHEGADGMAAYHRSALSAFAATQHLGSPAVVEVDGNRATFRANLISTHVHRPQHTRPEGNLPPLFATGTFVTGEARRTPQGWRLNLLAFRLLWADGSPPPAR